MKKIAVLLSVVLLLAMAACANNSNSTQQEAFMEKNEAVLAISDALSCDERTAASLYDTLLTGGVRDIAALETVDNPVYQILQITDSQGRVYFAFVAPGHFLEEIRVDRIDGEQIFLEIE